MTAAFTVPGKPGAKGRPRVVGGHAYTDARTVEYENLVRVCYQQQADVKLVGELAAEIKAFFPIPKSTPKRKQKDMWELNTGYAKRPDADNIAKVILDALNTIAFDDDAQVTALTVKKYYAGEPRVEVELRELGDSHRKGKSHD